MIFTMTDRSMTVTEAARHFADLVNRTYYRGESTVLIRSGEPVAMVIPVGGAGPPDRGCLPRSRAFPHLWSCDPDVLPSALDRRPESLPLPHSPWA